MNYLALNLAHDVALGKRPVEEARSFYAQTVVAFMKGEKSESTQKLNFSTGKNTGDPDKPEIDKKIVFLLNSVDRLFSYHHLFKRTAILI